MSDFLLNPAAIIFLDDVAKEYGVKDTSLFGAMVPTIIYRELQDRFGLGLPNADYPPYQHSWDKFKVFMHLPWYFGWPIEKLEGGLSLGIGALSRTAALKIESDAKMLDFEIYFPALEFDLQTHLDEIPFAKGKHTIRQYAGSDVFAAKQHLKVIPPSNEYDGVWRVELPRIASGSDLRKSYEPTLGYIAAEVAIAMQSTQYQELQTAGERVAFLIANHANRSAIPAKKDYNPMNFTSATHSEIGWAEDFELLMDEVRTENQIGAEAG